MSYITKEEVKLFLTLSWTSEDTLIDSLIVDSEAIINSLFDVDSFEEWTRTDMLKFNYKDQVYYLKNMPVSSIDKINGIAFTGSIWDEYLIVNNRQVIIRATLTPYFIDLKFEYFEIEYTAWYQVIPNWLKAMMKFLVGWLYNQRKTIWISQYSLWDENITFRNDWEYSQFKKMYNTHKKLKLWF